MSRQPRSIRTEGPVSRLRDLHRDDLTDEGKEVWDTIAAVRSSVSGPYGVVIRVPGLARQVVNSEDYFRFQSTLTAAERELVTLATARESGARFAWAVHERAGLRDGIMQQTIDAVRSQGALDSLAP